MDTNQCQIPLTQNNYLIPTYYCSLGILLFTISISLLLDLIIQQFFLEY